MIQWIFVDPKGKYTDFYYGYTKWEPKNDDAYFYQKNAKYTAKDKANWAVWGTAQKAVKKFYPDGTTKKFLGIPDSANGRFVVVGKAKFFTSIGTMSGSIFWTV